MSFRNIAMSYHLPKGLHSKLSSLNYIGLTFIKHYKAFLSLCHYPAASVQLLCNYVVPTSLFNASGFNLHMNFPCFYIIEEFKRSLVGYNSFCHFSFVHMACQQKINPSVSFKYPILKKWIVTQNNIEMYYRNKMWDTIFLYDKPRQFCSTDHNAL